MLLKSSLPGTTRHVLLTLSCHVNDAGEACYPSTTQLAEETGLSKRVVCLHLQQAAESGWITIQKHGFAGRKWNRNEYLLSWPEDRPAAGFSGEKKEDLNERGGDFNDTSGPRGGDFNDTEAVTQSNRLSPDHIYGFPSSIPNNPLIPLTAVAVDVRDRFEEFWQLIPAHRKIAKAKCRRLWERKRLDFRSDQVMAALKADLACEQWRKQGGEFIPHPATWLTQDRYERELMPVSHRPCVECQQKALFRIGHRDLCAIHFRAEGNQ